MYARPKLKEAKSFISGDFIQRNIPFTSIKKWLEQGLLVPLISRLKSIKPPVISSPRGYLLVFMSLEVIRFEVLELELMTGSKSLLLIFIFICSSCAQHVKISPRRCIAPNASWSIKTDEDLFTLKHHIRIDGDYTYIRKVFDSKKKECGDLDHINITHKYTWKDVLWNMVPLAGRSTLVINGSSSASKTKK